MKVEHWSSRKSWESGQVWNKYLYELLCKQTYNAIYIYQFLIKMKIIRSTSNRQYTKKEKLLTSKWNLIHIFYEVAIFFSFWRKLHKKFSHFSLLLYFIEVVSIFFALQLSLSEAPNRRCFFPFLDIALSNTVDSMFMHRWSQYY